MMMILAVVLGLNFYLYDVIPKGFFPQQDTGRLIGFIQADQSISFQLMQQKLTQFVTIIKKRSGGRDRRRLHRRRPDQFRLRVRLAEAARASARCRADGVIARLRREMAVVPGATLFLQAVQDIRVGGRASNAQYQYTLQGPTLEELNEWTPKIAAALQSEPQPGRRQQRPAEQGAGIRSGDRPRRRRATRRHRQPDRQHAL